jgi:voltage-gated potassium channel
MRFNEIKEKMKGVFRIPLKLIKNMRMLRKTSEEMPSPADDQQFKEIASQISQYSDKREKKRKKRKRLTFSEFWEVMNSNNTLTFFLIVAGLLAMSVFGAYFFEVGRNQEYRSLWDTLWWTIVTITTVGYGDKFPVTLGGRLVGILIMVLGVATVGIVTGRIASFLVNKQIKARGGLIVVERRKGHFIICGWKSGLENILENILKVNPQLRPSNIVLVNDADPEEIDHIRSIPEFRTLKYIKGDYIDEKVLQRANIKNASTALVLADSSRKFSVQEVDSRTVMAVITIDSMNKNIYTCAELIDEKFEKYLKLANCDEVILSREHARILIANAASASGIAHIASELLFPEHGGLLTEDVPGVMIGKTFKDLQLYFRELYGDIVIGMLENTGKIYFRKKEALADAQKTPDISKLIENLQSVKRLVPNHPILNPGDDYVIKRNSKAIVVTGKKHETVEMEEKVVHG